MEFKVLYGTPPGDHRNSTHSLRQIRLAMKWMLLFTVVACLQAWSETRSQTITLSVKNTSLEKVFKEIRKQAGYSFVYTKENLGRAHTVSLDVKQAGIRQVLDICFLDQPLSYTILENQVVVRLKKEDAPKNSSETLPTLIDIGGKVINEQGEGIEGVTVMVSGSNRATATDAEGWFELKRIDANAVLAVSGVNIESLEIPVSGRTTLTVTVKYRVIKGEEVIVNTGYQKIKPNEATGSFNIVNNDLLNRRVSTNILDRIENMTPGVSFKTPGELAVNNPYAILIRGRSTIYSSSAPLIVVDNFPYDGNIGNINPNDIENITILKDAAAASIWGARAGNGVIVITTKHGKSAKPQFEFNSNFSFQARPDIFNSNRISSADYIELEKFLFAKGYYASDISNNASGNPKPFTPVVELLIAKANGSLPAAEADQQIEAYKAHAALDDIKRYMYQNALNRQHSISVGGNSSQVNYYLSGGWDNNAGSVVGADYNRVTLRSQNTFRVSGKLQLDAGISFTQSDSKSENNAGYQIAGAKSMYPYAQLVDNTGQPLELNLDYRKIFTDTATGGGRLADWKYRPVEDIRYNHLLSKIRDYVLNTGFKYQIVKGLSLQVKYQYENALTSTKNLYEDGSYISRNLENSFFQPNATNKFPVPVGGIIDAGTNELISHQGRAQLNFARVFSRAHQLEAIGGWEIKDMKTSGMSYRMYGYKTQGSLVSTGIDYTSLFTQYSNKFSSNTVPAVQDVFETLDRFLSYYLNASYSFKQTYFLSMSGRSDAANLFGASTNAKGVPLMSMGTGWQMSNEKFYHFSSLPYLKLRATYGYNGNFSRAATALPTMTLGTSRTTQATMGTIQSPPNDHLRWEKVGMLNLAVDFETKNKVITGTAEYYFKNAKSLIAPTPIDPTLGFLVGNGGIPSVYENAASMKGQGFDVELNSRNIDRTVKWFTNVIFSSAYTRVTEYFVPASSNGRIYLTANSTINPTIGKPVYAVYGYYWSGLDPANGNPRGYLGKDVSSDWASILSKTKLDSLHYWGPAQPTVFGAIRNSVAWKQLSLSCTVSYKFGYYFRKPALSYTSLFSTWSGSGDYAKRWQNPGDEKSTNVPSLVYPANNNRDQFYALSDAMIEKGDHVRLEDIQVDYRIDKSVWKQIPCKEVRLYGYASNLSLLWKANHDGIDPYYVNVPKPAKSLSIGINIIF